MMNRFRKPFPALFSAARARSESGIERIRHAARRALRAAANVWRFVALAIGSIVLFSFLVSFMAGAFMPSKPAAPVMGDSILTLTLNQNVVDHVPSFMGFGFDSRPWALSEIINIFAHASTDKRIKAAIVFMPMGGMLTLTQIEELAPAIELFRAAGKKAYIFAPDYQSLADYAFASGFDNIWLQPAGMVQMAGLSFEQPFARGLLDRLGVVPHIFQRREFKTAYENMTARDLSPANRAMSQSLVDDLGGRLVTRIAGNRKRDEAFVKGAIDRALWSDEDALAQRLVDRVGTRADMESALAEEFGKSINLQDFTAYAPAAVKSPALKSGKPVVALIPVEGAIMARGPAPAFGGSDQYGADDIADAIFDAAARPDVKAIVVRINSPGGSPSAAETIRTALSYAKTQNKIIVASLGDVAASGGYWVAVAADTIVASPSTLTGSIGVVGGKFDFAPFAKGWGVAFDGVTFGRNADLFSPAQGFTPEQTAMMNGMFDSIYAHFIDRVAKARGLSPEQVEDIAKGRVWTGAQAFDRKLVDVMGGLGEALDHTARALGKDTRHDLSLIRLPDEPSPFELLSSILSGGVNMGAVLSRVAAEMNWAARSGAVAYDPRAVRVD